METSSVRPVYNLVSTLLSLTGIILLSIGTFDLHTPAEILSRSPENLTFPPGFTFSIWGLIYFGFLLYSIYQLLPAQQDNPRIKRTESYITLSILLNFAWVLFCGTGMIVLPYIILWMMFLISIFLLFSYGVPQTTRPLTERIIYALFAIYSGWLMVILFPFTTDLILQTEWSVEPLAPSLITIGVYFFATLIVLFAFRELKHTWFIFPLIWTLIGLSIKFSETMATMAWTTGSLALFVAIFFIYKLVQSVHMAHEAYHSYPLFMKKDTLNRFH
ncbi:MAG TPA: hypothetical protein VIT44_10760 [Cyclobacteriaceae bacterium]